MGGCYQGRQVKAHTRAAGLSRPRRIRPVEWLSQVGRLLPGQPWAMVADGQGYGDVIRVGRSRLRYAQTQE